MNDKPRQVLCALIGKQGSSLVGEPGRCSGLLRDLCGNHKTEIHMLIAAMEEGVPSVLMTQSRTGSPPEIVVARQVKRLQDDRGLTEEYARWAVESWALALGVISTVSVPRSPPPLKPTPTSIPIPPPPTPLNRALRKIALVVVVGMTLIAGVTLMNKPQPPVPPVSLSPVPLPPVPLPPVLPPTPRVLYDELEALVRDYFAALNRRDVSAVVAKWKVPPKNLIALVLNTEYSFINEIQVETAETYRATVRVDVTGKTLDGESPEHWQGVIELEPTGLGGWSIVSLNLSLAGSIPAPPPAGEAGRDELTALVREYYAALDRRDVNAAVAQWKVPPKSLIALVRNTEYFKVNDARVVRAYASQASVWVDVVGKTFDKSASEHWRGEIELERIGSGNWVITAMNLHR